MTCKPVFEASAIAVITIRRAAEGLVSNAVRQGAWTSTGVAVILAVIATEIGGDGWESNPPRTPQQRPANGFEDRGRHQPPIIPSSKARLALGGSS